METTLYQSIFIQQWPCWVGGILIGLLVPIMYYFLNTPFGVSTSYGNMAKIMVPRTKLKWLNTKTFEDVFNWRIFFVAGIILGAFLSSRFSGMSFITTEMGRFTSTVDWSFPYLAIWFLGGGILLGLGSRIAGGCTSGHSIHGIANLQLSSLISTIFFLGVGGLTVYLIRILIFGGG